jgi:hypothetical protein
MNKKPIVAAKAVAKKRGRPVGSKAKPKAVPDFPLKNISKPVNWEQLCKRLQEALAKEMREADELREELARKRNFFERLVCLTTGSV